MAVGENEQGAEFWRTAMKFNMRSAIGAAVVAVCSMVAVAQPVGLSWSNVTPATMPPVRRHFGMAFDEARGNSVIFGGLANPSGPGPVDHEYGDTWTSTASGWVQRNVVGPSLRSAPAMAYDPVRQRIVLFGGTFVPAAGPNEGPRVFYQDTWEWSGAAWTQIATANAPRTRSGAAMAYDPVRGRIVLAGGTFYNHQAGRWESLSDCWEWDGAAWVEAAPLPSPVSYAPMAYDAARQRLVIFSGVCAQCYNVNAQTFERAGQTWVGISASGPAPRANHMMAYVPELNGTVLFGGTLGNPDGEVADTWLWNGGSWQQLTLNPSPSRRGEGRLVYDSMRHRAVMMFGYLINTETLISEQWELAAPCNGSSAWDVTTPAAPPDARWSAMGCYSPVNQQLLVFGGWCCGRSDMWALSGNVWTQLNPATRPAGRLRGGMVWDESRQKAVLFGGLGSSPFPTLGDTWEWDGAAWVQRNIAGPSARSDHSMAYDAARGRVVLWGGITGARAKLTDTWEYDGTQWVRAATGGLPASSPATNGSAIAYDASLQRTVLVFPTGPVDDGSHLAGR